MRQPSSEEEKSIMATFIRIKRVEEVEIEDGTRERKYGAKI